MAEDTTFVPNSEPPIRASWLNAINDFFFGTFGGATTPEQARAAIGIPPQGDIGAADFNLLTTIFGTLLSSNDDTVTAWTAAGANTIPSSETGTGIRGFGSNGTTVWGENFTGVYTLDYATGTATQIAATAPSILGATRSKIVASTTTGQVFVANDRGVQQVDPSNFTAIGGAIDLRNVLPSGTLAPENYWYGNGFFWVLDNSLVYRFTESFAYTGLVFDPTDEDTSDIQAAAWDGERWWVTMAPNSVRTYTEDWVPSSAIIPLGSTTASSDGFVFLDDRLTGPTQGQLVAVISTVNVLSLENIGLLVTVGDDLLLPGATPDPATQRFVRVTQVLDDDRIAVDTPLIIPPSEEGNVFRRNSIGDVVTVVRTSNPFLSAWRAPVEGS